MRDDRVKVWQHKKTGDQFEVRMTDEYKTARRIRRGDTGENSLSRAARIPTRITRSGPSWRRMPTSTRKSRCAR